MGNLIRRLLDWLDRQAAIGQREDAAEGGTRKDWEEWERLRDDIADLKRKH